MSNATGTHLLSPFTSVADSVEKGLNVITEGDGIRIRDRAGNEFIDAMAGLWCVNVGYGRREIMDAVAEQGKRLPYYHSFMGMSNEPSIALADRVTSMAPGTLNHIFFANSGSEANDSHVKLVWYYNNLLGRPEKKKIIARIGAYHGVTVASASLSGLAPLHAKFDVPYGDRFHHVSRPHHYWEAEEGMSEEAFSAKLAAELEQKILDEGPETIAAFIAEPIMGAGGVIVPPKGYFEAVVPILKKHDILFIADEVVCGFGRLGTNFGSTYFGLEPDLMTVAKGLTSGYVPMSGCLVADHIFNTLQEHSGETGPFAHGFTYSAHPIAAAAGIANLDLIKNEKLIENAADVGPYLQEQLRSRFADHKYVGQVRGEGCVAGIEIVADKAKKTAFTPESKAGIRLAGLLREEGLICRPIVNTLAFSPPLILTREDIDEICDRFERGLALFEG